MVTGVQKSSVGTVGSNSIGGQSCCPSREKQTKVVFPEQAKEIIQDAFAALLTDTDHENVTIEYDDELNKLILTVDASGASLGDIPDRVQALEEATDGIVSGATPLNYYLLARGN